jgi:hypothetical protein
MPEGEIYKLGKRVKSYKTEDVRCDFIEKILDSIKKKEKPYSINSDRTL